jgi:hypothetical protein
MNILSLLSSLLRSPEAPLTIPGTSSVPDHRQGILVKQPRCVVLFLDFDGVLHPCQSGSFRHMPLFEQWLLTHPSVEVVVSSTWRETHTFTELCSLFPATVRDRIIGTTPVFEDRLREDEIQHFACRHGIAHWFCIDDQVSDFPSIRESRLVATEYVRGITAEILREMSRRVALAEAGLSA